jgi:hypothetical protein
MKKLHEALSVFRWKLLLTFCLFCNLHLMAQDKVPVNFGKVEQNDFSVNSPLVDKNTSAVIIADVGTTKFEGNNKGWFSYVFKRQRRIKIIDKKSFDLATVSILLYRNEEGEEKVEDVSAVTYNLENGKVVETKLSSKELYLQKADKNHFFKKFTLPGIREGSVIEYSYTIKSDFIFNIPSWEFQDEKYPALWSEFNVVMPGLLSYMSFFQGYHKFHINKATNGFQNFLIRRNFDDGVAVAYSRDQSISVASPVVKQKWVIKDLTPFDEEQYLASPKNYLDKISFQLYKTYDGERFHDVANNWKTVNHTLLQRDDFGLPLAENTAWLDALAKKILDGTETGIKAAEKIYYYVQDNYTCTDRYDKYIETSLQDVVRKKSGSVGELNLLLVALLKRKFPAASPVLLSTREFGRNSKDYPEMSRLNYVIGTLKIDNVDYLLDASVPFLPFGKLPANCYNGDAHVVSEDSMTINLDPKLHKETSVVNVLMNMNEKNELEGTYNKIHGLYESIETRAEIAQSAKAFKAKLAASFPEELIVSEVIVDSAKRREDPVTLKVNFKIKPTDADIIYFNPMLLETVKSNPFHADSRKYPVELPYTSVDNYVLTMDIPKGYKVEELPKSARISLNANEGIFEYLVQASNNSIMLRSSLVMSEATFSSEDYQSLRDFFAYVVKKHAEQIVLKKIK